MRRRSGGRAVRCTVALVATVALAGCHHWNVNRFATPEALYQASVRAYRHGKWDDASDGFQRLSYDLPPGDSLRQRVKFYAAECHFGMGDYVTSAREFRNLAD